jgi:amino acid permease
VVLYSKCCTTFSTTPTNSSFPLLPLDSLLHTMKEGSSLDISLGTPTDSVTDKDGAIIKEKDDSINQLSTTVSVAQGKAIEGDYGAESELKRSLSTRHMSMIALGSSIGMGLWLGAGKSLVNGGPVALFIAYIIAGTMVWCVSHSIGELAVMYPVPSALIQWSAKFVGKPAGFSLGWAYWCSYMLTIGNELVVCLTPIANAY